MVRERHLHRLGGPRCVRLRLPGHRPLVHKRRHGVVVAAGARGVHRRRHAVVEKGRQVAGLQRGGGRRGVRPPLVRAQPGGPRGEQGGGGRAGHEQACGGGVLPPVAVVGELLGGAAGWAGALLSVGAWGTGGEVKGDATRVGTASRPAGTCIGRAPAPMPKVGLAPWARRLSRCKCVCRARGVASSRDSNVLKSTGSWSSPSPSPGASKSDRPDRP